MTDYIIIVAGGKGLRMGSDIPKQFLPIGGKPVLMRTLERFREYSVDLQIILVLPKAQQVYWHQLCKEYHFYVEYMLADGGETRFHSVQHGLALIPDDAEGVVGVHDGVRPFPSIDVIRSCYETARKAKAVIPVIPVVETLRQIICSGLQDSYSKTGEKVLKSCSPCKNKKTEKKSLSPVVLVKKNAKYPATRHTIPAGRWPFAQKDAQRRVGHHMLWRLVAVFPL